MLLICFHISVFVSVYVCVCVHATGGSVTDSYSDWAELCPIERGCVQLIEFMSEYFLSCRLSGGILGCIHLHCPATVNLCDCLQILPSVLW